MSLRRAAALPWLLYAATAVAASADAGQESAVSTATALYRQGQADGVQLAQALYCDLPEAEVVRFLDALQRAARERALAAGVDFDATGHEAAMQAGFDDFRQLMAVIDAQGGSQDVAQRQAHRQEQCAEIRTDVDTLLGSQSTDGTKD